MIDRQQLPGNDYDDDGAGLLAILGVVLVLTLIAASVVINLQL
jgi:hypothetical protein